MVARINALRALDILTKSSKSSYVTQHLEWNTNYIVLQVY